MRITTSHHGPRLLFPAQPGPIRRATAMKTAMMRSPCRRCPFRRDTPIYLRRERRVEIAETLLRGQTFHCHETTSHGEDDDGETYTYTTKDSIPCAGAEKALMAVGQTTQMARISERLGLLDLDAIEASPVECWPLYEWMDLAEGATGDDPVQDEHGETCSVVNSGCLAPAGFAVGGGAVPGTEFVDTYCPGCGEAVCENCSDDEGLCLNGMCSEMGIDDEDEGW